MQNYKCLRAVLTICATWLTSRQTHKHTDTQHYEQFSQLS